MTSPELYDKVLYKVQILYDFEPEGETEIKVVEDEIVEVTWHSEEWSIGKTSDGRIGLDGELQSQVSKIIEPKVSEARPEPTIEIKKKAVDCISRCWKRHKFRKRMNTRKIRERMNLIKELIVSEQNYVNYLTLIRDLYIIPMKSKETKKGNGKTETEIMFGYLEQILKLAELFVQELKATQSHTNSSTVYPKNKKKLVNVISFFVPFMKFYAEYVKNYENAVQLYNEKNKKDKEFANLLKAGKADPRSKGLELRDLLSKPFQRIFAYKNIFNRMLEITPLESSAYLETEKVAKIIEQTVSYINEQKRQFENTQKMLNVHKRLTSLHNNWDEADQFQDTFIKRWRRYIMDGRLMVSVNEKEFQWAESYLASDIFFVILDNNIYVMYLCFMKVESTNDETLFLKSYPNSCTVKFANPEMKKDWHDAINKWIQEEEIHAAKFGFSNTSEMFHNFKKSLETFPNMREQLNSFCRDIAEVDNSLSKVNRKIDDLKEEVRERLKNISLQQESRKKYLQRRNDLRDAQFTKVKQYETAIEKSLERVRDLSILLRGEDIFKDSKELAEINSCKDELDQVIQIEVDEIKNSMSEPQINRVIRFPSSIWSERLYAEFQRVDAHIDPALDDLRKLINGTEGNDVCFGLTAQIYELTQKLSWSFERIKSLQKEKSNALDLLKEEQEKVYKYQNRMKLISESRSSSMRYHQEKDEIAISIREEANSEIKLFQEQTILALRDKQEAEEKLMNREKEYLEMKSKVAETSSKLEDLNLQKQKLQLTNEQLIHEIESLKQQRNQHSIQSKEMQARIQMLSQAVSSYSENKIAKHKLKCGQQQEKQKTKAPMPKFTLDRTLLHSPKSLSTSFEGLPHSNVSALEEDDKGEELNDCKAKISTLEKILEELRSEKQSIWEQSTKRMDQLNVVHCSQIKSHQQIIKSLYNNNELIQQQLRNVLKANMEAEEQIIAMQGRSVFDFRIFDKLEKDISNFRKDDEIRKMQLLQASLKITKLEKQCTQLRTENEDLMQKLLGAQKSGEVVICKVPPKVSKPLPNLPTKQSGSSPQTESNKKENVIRMLSYTENNSVVSSESQKELPGEIPKVHQKVFHGNTPKDVPKEKLQKEHAKDNASVLPQEVSKKGSRQAHGDTLQETSPELHKQTPSQTIQPIATSAIKSKIMELQKNASPSSSSVNHKHKSVPNDFSQQLQDKLKRRSTTFVEKKQEEDSSSKPPPQRHSTFFNPAMMSELNKKFEKRQQQ